MRSLSYRANCYCLHARKVRTFASENTSTALYTIDKHNSTCEAPQSSKGRLELQKMENQRHRPSQGQLASAAAFPSPVPLIDIGVNLVDHSYHKDLKEVLHRAKEANVAAVLVTGTCVSTSKAAAEICDQHASGSPGLCFTAGVHPHHAKKCGKDTLNELRSLANHPRCVAIGECGLDFNRNFSPQDVQERWFEEQVKLARELKRPLFMHCRDAGERFAEILSRHLPLTAPAVVHCFTGNREELERFLEMGLYIGITGWICDDRPERGGADLAALLASIPRNRLMIETDAPYLTPRCIKPSKARPGRNEPCLLPYVLRAAAAALGVSEEELGRLTTAVACKVFQLPAATLGLSDGSMP